jgi:hypothetical protein
VIEASLEDSTRTITGHVTVTWYSVDSSYSDPHFRLWGNRVCEKLTKDADTASDCSIIVDSVQIENHPISREVVVAGTDLVLSLSIDSTLDSLTVQIWFRTVVPITADRFGFTGGNFLLDGWFPMPAPHRDGRWLVVNYDDESELVGDFYDFEATFTHSKDFQCIAPGRFKADTLENSIRDQFRLSPAHDFVLLLGKEFKQKEYSNGQTRVTFHFLSRNEHAVDSTAQSVLYTLDWMAREVGPYPFDELVVVQTQFGIFGGVEYPQMYWQSEVSTGEYVRFDRNVAIHETVHQWFYGIFASNQAEEPWLDESITEYFAERISSDEAKGRPDQANIFGITSRASSDSRFRGHYYLPKLAITRSALDYSNRDYYSVIYGKGPMIIKTIVGLLGSEAPTFWHTYYQTQIFRHPTDRDFINLLNQFPPFSDRNDAAELIRTTDMIDYRIESLTSEQVSDSEGYKSTVKIVAYNPLPYPVKFRLEFPTAEPFDTLIFPTPGQSELTFTRPEPVYSAYIDPDRVYAVDVNYLNNSYSREWHGAAFRLFSGITFLVESLYSMFWGI